MYCPNCGHKVEDNTMYCPECGKLLKKDGNLKRQQDININYELEKKKQPTKALVVEGIGFLFFIYLLLIDRDWEYQGWVEDNGVWVFLIGLVFIAISYFMFKRFKKNQLLTGLGYAGYVVSCIAMVIIIAILILGIPSSILSVIVFNMATGR